MLDFHLRLLIEFMEFIDQDAQNAIITRRVTRRVLFQKM